MPFANTSKNYPNIKDKVIFKFNNFDFIKGIPDLKNLDLLLDNAISKMISIENESFSKYLIEHTESIEISTDDLEKTILSHYGDTIILLNPTIAPLIPNAIKIQKNLYFINEIEESMILCVDNRDNCLFIHENLNFRIVQLEFGIFSFKELEISNISGIKNYELKEF